MSIKLFQTTRALVIMAKAPSLEGCKTRLYRGSWLDVESVKSIYEGFLMDTVELASTVLSTNVTIVCPDLDHERPIKKLLSKWKYEDVAVLSQEGSGLMSGISWSFSRLTDLGFKQIGVIAADSPTLPGIALEQAFQMLRQNDVVLGRCEDGGYYFVGAKEPHPALFNSGRTPPEQVFQSTIEKAKKLKLQTGLIRQFYDVDTPDDLCRLVSEIRGRRDRAPRTWDALHRLGLLNYEIVPSTHQRRIQNGSLGIEPMSSQGNCIFS